MTQERTGGHRVLSVLSEHEQLTELLAEISTGVNALGDALSAIEMGIAALADKLATTMERTSSVEVKTSTRGVDVSAKGYVGSDISVAGAAAVAEYFRVVDMVEAELAFRKAAD